MAYNSDGYIMIDFTEVDFRRTNQTIDGLYKRCVDVIGTNKFILVINANGRTPLPATCSFTNNQYVIDTCIYMFAISSNDNLFIRRNDVPASDIIDDSSVSVDKTWSSNKIDTELDGKADTSALADYQPKLIAGTNITIDENNVISSTGGAVIDDSVMVNNKVWSSLNTVEMLAPIDTVVGSPATFNTSLSLPLVSCKSNFICTQEAGTPSPSNPLAITGVDDITITANGNSVVIDLDGTRYGGYIDVVNNKLVLTHYHFVPDNNTVIQLYNHGSINSLFRIYFENNNIPVGVPNTILSSHFSRNISSGSGKLYNNDTLIAFDIDNSLISPENATGLKAWFIANSVEFVYEMATHIEISLSDIPTLSTIIGNNSFASDTGSLTVSYKALPIDLL